MIPPPTRCTPPPFPQSGLSLASLTKPYLPFFDALNDLVVVLCFSLYISLMIFPSQIPDVFYFFFGVNSHLPQIKQAPVLLGSWVSRLLRIFNLLMSPKISFRGFEALPRFPPASCGRIPPPPPPPVPFSSTPPSSSLICSPSWRAVNSFHFPP